MPKINWRKERLPGVLLLWTWNNHHLNFAFILSCICLTYHPLMLIHRWLNGTISSFSFPFFFFIMDVICPLSPELPILIRFVKNWCVKKKSIYFLFFWPHFVHINGNRVFNGIMLKVIFCMLFFSLINFSKLLSKALIIVFINHMTLIPQSRGITIHSVILLWH